MLDLKDLRGSDPRQSHAEVAGNSGITLASSHDPERACRRNGIGEFNPPESFQSPRTETLLESIVPSCWLDFADPRRPEMTDGMYGVVLGVILLFPWSIVAMMVAGTFWGRIRAFVHVRRRR